MLFSLELFVGFVLGVCVVQFYHSPHSFRDLYKFILLPFCTNGPFIPLDEFPEMEVVTNIHETVAREYDDHMTRTDGRVPKFHKFQLGENPPHETFYHKWGVILLRVQGRDVSLNAQLFPSTMYAIDAVAQSRTPHHFWEPRIRVRHAMFSVLQPGKSVEPYVAAFRSVLRYILPIRVPTGSGTGSYWIKVSHGKEVWKAGVPVMYDATFRTEEGNGSDEPSVALFLEVERRFPLPLLWFDRALTWLLSYHKTTREIIAHANDETRRNTRNLDDHITTG